MDFFVSCMKPPSDYVSDVCFILRYIFI